MGFSLLNDESSVIRPEDMRRVQLRVCGAAKDAAEARMMLDFLGLLPAADEKPDKAEYYELCMRRKHRLTPENTVFGDRGGRKCRACRDEREARMVTPFTSEPPPGKNQNPDFCRNGHSKLQYGYHRRSNGERECWKCYDNRREEERARRAAKLGPRRKKCSAGHPWTAENTRMQPAGDKRRCGICADAKKKGRLTT